MAQPPCSTGVLAPCANSSSSSPCEWQRMLRRTSTPDGSIRGSSRMHFDGVPGGAISRVAVDVISPQNGAPSASESRRAATRAPPAMPSLAFLGEAGGRLGEGGDCDPSTARSTAATGGGLCASPVVLCRRDVISSCWDHSAAVSSTSSGDPTRRGTWAVGSGRYPVVNSSPAVPRQDR